MDLKPILPVTRWPGRRHPADSRLVFVPALDRFPAHLRELMGLLPVCDINGALLEALQSVPARPPRQLVAGLFAADPFLDSVEMTAALRRAGIGAVANYPTLQLVDGATGQGLAAVGYQARSEYVRLVEMRASGLDVLAYAASAAAAEEAIGMGIDTLVAHPGLGPDAAGRGVIGRIEAVAAAAGVRLLHHAGFEAGAQPVSP